MNRFVLPICLMICFAGEGCTKRNEPAAPPSSTTPLAQAVITPGQCGTQSSAALLADIQAQETAKTKLDQTAKAAPSKENFKKVYAAELAFIAETEKTIEALAQCKDPVSTEAIEAVKKKVATSRTNVDYLAESFPDFK